MRTGQAKEGLTIVVMTPEELEALVARAVEQALDNLPRASAPKLLDRQGLARYLDKGVASIDRLVREGMPYLRAGDTKRFEVAAVLAWMKEQTSLRAKTPTDDA